MRSRPERLVELGEQCLTNQALRESLIVTQPPACGTLMLQVREPVRRERFYLGEILVTRCEVRIGADRGWAMIDGDEPRAALAAAICDVVSRTTAAEHEPLRLAIDSLCRETNEHLAAREQREWNQIADTRVRFEEFE
jgi:hypothetical protein